MARGRASGRKRVRHAPVGEPRGDDARAAAGSGPAARGEPSEDAIRVRAYEIYLGRGGTSGRELEDWLAAERALRTAAPGELS